MNEDPIRLYLFHRGDYFYPITLRSDEEAVENAKCNPGTDKVTNALTNETIWESQPTQPNQQD